MRCARFREAVSARLDGEDPGIPPARVDAHLLDCAACRSWATAATQVAQVVGAGPAAPVTVAPGVLATLLAGGDTPRRPAEGVGVWRLVLALAGVAQLVLSGIAPLLHGDHTHGHLAHELASLDLGLALGFLFLAWRPSRAWGALPLVAALVASLLAASAADVLLGHALLGREIVHVLELAGLGACWGLARRVPRPSVVLRLAEAAPAA